MNRLIVANSNTAGARPGAGTRQPGELWVNMADGVLGFIDPGGNAVDVTLGVVPAKPAGTAAFLIIDQNGFPAWLDLGTEGLIATPAVGVNQTIQVQSPSDVPLSLKGHASQVADLLRVRASDESRRLDVTPAGVTRATGPAAGMLELAVSGAGGTVRKLGISSGLLTVDGGVRASGPVSVTNGTTTRQLSLSGTALQVDGNFTATGDLAVTGRTYLDNALHIDAVAGHADVVLRDSIGTTNRGLLRAASDGSYFRLEKTGGRRLDLTDLDAQLNVNAGLEAADSVVTRRRLSRGRLPDVLVRSRSGSSATTLPLNETLRNEGGFATLANDALLVQPGTYLIEATCQLRRFSSGTIATASFALRNHSSGYLNAWGIRGGELGIGGMGTVSAVQTIGTATNFSLHFTRDSVDFSSDGNSTAEHPNTETRSMKVWRLED